MVRRVTIVGFIILASAFAGEKKKKTHDYIAGRADLRSNASKLKGTVVTPVLEAPIDGKKNVLWCNTMQLAWNELMRLGGGKIEMKNAPSYLSALNRSTISKKDLDDASYVAMAGKGNNTVQRIRAELNKKFQGQECPGLLDSVPPGQLVAYAYLFKNLPFQHRFRRYKRSLRFSGYYVDSFGMKSKPSDDSDLMADQIDIVDYRNRDDLIIELSTSSKDDHVLLAKLKPLKTLADTIKAVDRRVQEKAENDRKMNELELDGDDEEIVAFCAPVIDFLVLRKYDGLTGKPLRSVKKRSAITQLGVAAQSIRFRLDERGAVLKSEAVPAAGSIPQKRFLIFDKPYLIMLKRRDAKNPYFALWVANTELLVPVKKTKAPVKKSKAKKK